MSGAVRNDDRWLDLLSQRATQGLSWREQSEFETLAPRYSAAEVEDLELAAAALDEALRGPTEPLPDAVRARLEAAADAWVAQSASAAIPIQRGRSRVSAWLGWAAAAACLLVVGLAWMRGQPQATPALSPAQQRSALLETQRDVITAPWIGVGDLPIAGAADHPLDRGVTGDVVWSDAENKGFMRISGVAENDPKVYQYQLWIFDADRPAGDLPQFAAPGLPDLLTQRPVDGGVFDIHPDAKGEAVVPIDAKLRIGAGTIFAVTRERPGGVVVSDREIVFLAIKS